MEEQFPREWRPWQSNDAVELHGVDEVRRDDEGRRMRGVGKMCGVGRR